MQVAHSEKIKKALERIALGFEYENLDEEYLTVREFEEKMKKNYGTDKKAKDDKNLNHNKSQVNGQIDMFDEGIESDNVVRICENVKEIGEIEVTKRGRKRRRLDDKYNLICVKKKVEHKYHAPEVTALKMLVEIEKNEEARGVDKIVEEIKSMAIDELIEFRLRLLAELEKEKDES
jgi:hypothetical protein